MRLGDVWKSLAQNFGRVEWRGIIIENCAAYGTGVLCRQPCTETSVAKDVVAGGADDVFAGAVVAAAEVFSAYVTVGFVVGEDGGLDLGHLDGVEWPCLGRNRRHWRFLS